MGNTMIFLGQKEEEKKRKKKTHLLGHLCFLCIDAQGIWVGEILNINLKFKITFS